VDQAAARRNSMAPRHLLKQVLMVALMARYQGLPCRINLPCHSTLAQVRLSSSGLRKAVWLDLSV